MITSIAQPASSRRSLFSLSLGLGVAAMLPRPALAQGGDPDRPVRLVVPVAPGGSLDIPGRTFARAVTRGLGQPVVVENHAGAGSNLGFALVARARPDGHTLLVGSDPLAINPALYRRVNFDPVRDFAPIIEPVRAPQALVVHPASPVTDLASFLRLARRADGAMTRGSLGNGSIWHLAGAMLTQRTGATFTHVPYRGGGPAVIDVVAPHLDALRRTDLAEGLIAQGFETRGGAPEDFAALIRAEAARWPGIVRLAQATLD